MVSGFLPGWELGVGSGAAGAGGMHLVGFLGLRWDVGAVHERGWMAWFGGQPQDGAGFGATLLIARTTW